MDRVVAVVRSKPRRRWTTAQVAQAVGAAPTTVSTLLARATERGLIRRAERGSYQAT
jgi:predicted transcriptional regulator of viral defense system